MVGREILDLLLLEPLQHLEVIPPFTQHGTEPINLATFALHLTEGVYKVILVIVNAINQVGHVSFEPIGHSTKLLAGPLEVGLGQCERRVECAHLPCASASA